MKVLTPVLLIFGMCVMLMSCKSNAKVTSLDNYTKNMIAFSTGGGFTGVETIFTILENGQVFSASGLDPKKTIAVWKITHESRQVFFRKSKSDQLGERSYQRPRKPIPYTFFRHQWKHEKTSMGRRKRNPFERDHRFIL
jgi:hypothetical protein